MNYLDQILDSCTSVPTAALIQQIRTTCAHHAPTGETISKAVRLGDAAILQALLSSGRMNDAQRAEAAQAGLATLGNDPLGFHQPQALLQILMEHGADGAKPGRGESFAETIGAQLGRIETNERALMDAGKLRFSTGSGDVLRKCWAVMERAGVDLAQARRQRDTAGMTPLERARAARNETRSATRGPARPTLG